MNTPTPLHDIVVYGATGFTGRLVAQHLASRGSDAGDWAVAGRNPDKLSALTDDLGINVPELLADSSKPASLVAMAERAKVVISTVGPYAKFGDELVAACAETGTDYVDLTGEVQWAQRMIDRHAATAQQSGARIVHACGFDSIPSDLGTLYAQSVMQERHGVHATSVRMALKAARGGASGGTLDSMITIMTEAAQDPTVAAMIDDPYALLPQGERIGPHCPDRTEASYDDGFDAWLAPFVMELINGRIVRRSNALLGYPWTREFRYGEAVMMGRGATGQARATAFAAGYAAARVALRSGAVRDLASRLLPGAGSGPDEASRERGFFDVRLIAEHPDSPDADVHVKVTADRDPGYGATARMLGEAALTLSHGESTVAGGSWTPASALGTALIERLRAHAGMTFEVA